MTRTQIDLTPLLPFSRVTAAQLAQTASRYEARLTLESEGKVINAKSMLGLLSQPTLAEESITLCADGEDEKAATTAILALLKAR